MRKVNTQFRVYERPGGDFAVDRALPGGRKQRWGLYETRREADGQARLANAGLAAAEKQTTR